MVDSLTQYIPENRLREQSALEQKKAKVKESKSRPEILNMMRNEALVTNSSWQGTID